MQGIMKLAKMDFLLRYPNCLVRALKAIGKEAAAQEIPEEERNTIEARMIRFRFGALGQTLSPLDRVACGIVCRRLLCNEAERLYL